MGPGLPGGGTDLRLGRGFGLQAEVFFRRSVGSTHGGLETAATPVRLNSLRNDPASAGGLTGLEALVPLGLTSIDAGISLRKHDRLRGTQLVVATPEEEQGSFLFFSRCHFSRLYFA